MNRPRRAFLLSCLCGAFAIRVGAQAPQPMPVPTAQPKLVIVEPVFDFGEAPINSVLNHDFQIRNEGTADLMIQDVVAGCSCTAASSDPVVKPGATGTIHTALDTSGMEGAVAKQIRFSSNDPALSRAALTLRVVIRSHTTFLPSAIRLKGVQHDAPASAAVLLWALDRDDLTIEKIESPYSYVKIAYRETTAGEAAPDGRGRQWRIEATLDPEAPLGSLAALARIHTNHPSDALISLPITGIQQPLLSVAPPSATLDDVKAGPGYERLLRFENAGSAPVAVTGATCDVPGVAIASRALPDGKHAELAIHLAGDMPKGRFHGTIVVSTTSAAVPRIEIPITGNVQ